MRTNLLETYERQLKVAEAYVAKNFEGKKVSANTQLTTAVLLDNTNRYMTESLNTEIVAANRTNLGDWKKFCLNLTNIAVPSLIANDLVIVHPMTSFSGSVAYLKYVATTDKGGMQGVELNSPFRLGDPEALKGKDRVNYTSQIIVEKCDTDVNDLTFKYDADDAKSEIVADGITYVADNGVDVKYATFKVIHADGKVEYTDDSTAIDAGAKVAYVAKQFQMAKVPATEIPTIGPKMERIPLVAEPRRIAVRYDQITAFQAKTDYGFSLDKQIAEQACGELAYEIDTEIVKMLEEGAGEAVADLKWSKTLPVGVSKWEHYNGFLEIIERARAIIYKRTRKFHPNYMVIAPDVLPVLKFVQGFSGNKVSKMNGPYKVGTIDSLDVYVSPELDGGKFFFGLNGSDMMSSAGVYAPYMAIVPTQLLGTPDGGLAQGFSTWYAKALLNKALLVAGEITD